MADVPPLTKVWAKGPEAGHEFERLMKKLLIHDGWLKGYVFEPGATYKDEGIDGIVKKNYPGMDCPVIFQFKWLEGPINKGSATQQIEDSFARLLTTGRHFKSYVLITPSNFTTAEKEWFEKLHADYKEDIAVYHFGHDEIQVLLDSYPVLKKYCYGVQIEGETQNFIMIEEKYRYAISEEVKYLHFIGIPTGSYQKQQLLEKPELAKIYIPLDFTNEPGASLRTNLREILKEFHRVVVLGDPGSGKSTLAKYLASIHTRLPGQDQEPGIDNLIPFIIPIREFVRQKQEKKSRNFNFIDYLKTITDTNYSFNDVDKDFFVAQLDMGKAIVLFDGLDEVASENGRIRVAQDIQQFSIQYPECPVWVTSRVVGYTVDVKLDATVFQHYYLAPVTPDQAGEFIKKWYEIQIPNSETARNDRVHSLQYAIENNPGVQRLKTNPLLLTMMTLVHQFEGTLPDDRARLYEKCIELLLKTWQEQKYMALGIKNPLEERDLSYNDQLKMLAAAAFYIQGKNQEMKENIRGLIEEKELIQVLVKTRYDKKRMSEEKAKEDVRVFLDYIRDRAGLLAEKGRNEKGENVFAFVHLSFLEYLCAYQVAEDKSKSQQQHIQRLLTYIAKPAWEEPILLSLYLFAKSTGPSFIDAFSEEVFKKLRIGRSIYGWFLLGRAVRDNTGFAHDDIKQIISQILKIHLVGRREDIAESIIREIARFSKEGKPILKEVLKESIGSNSAEKAFESLYLYSQFYDIDSQFPMIISKNPDRFDLFPYLPVYRANEILAGYIEQSLEETQWILYYSSAADKTVDNLERLTVAQINPIEMRGYIIVAWTKLFAAFQARRELIEKNRLQLKLMDNIKTLNSNFGGYASINYPVNSFQNVAEGIGNVGISKISSFRFTREEKEMEIPLDIKSLEEWIIKIHLNSERNIDKATSKDLAITEIEKKQITDRVIEYSQDFKRYFRRKFRRKFRRYLSIYFSRDFSLYFSLFFRVDFIRKFTRDFNRDFGQYFIAGFARKFGQYFIAGLSRKFIREFNQDLKDLISDLYPKKYSETLEWGKLNERNEEMIYNLLVDELEKGNTQLIDGVSKYFYIYTLQEKYELSYSPSCSEAHSPNGKKVHETMQQRISLTLTNPLAIPLTFNFIFSAALSHYMFNMFADLNYKFFKNENLTGEMIYKAADDYVANNSFELYFVNFSWDFYAQAFNERYSTLNDGEEKNLALAAFVVNAARVSLLAGVPCEGDEWEKTLTAANNSTYPFVNISHTLYKICNFMDKDKTPALLNEQLTQFKRDFPQYYKLIGFQQK